MMAIFAFNIFFYTFVHLIVLLYEKKCADYKLSGL